MTIRLLTQLLICIEHERLSVWYSSLDNVQNNVVLKVSFELENVFLREWRRFAMWQTVPLQVTQLSLSGLILSE